MNVHDITLEKAEELFNIVASVWDGSMLEIFADMFWSEMSRQIALNISNRRII